MPLPAKEEKVTEESVGETVQLFIDTDGAKKVVATKERGKKTWTVEAE